MTRPDPALVRDWLTARSIARGLPLPVADHGGLRVDTGSAEERRRYVFVAPCAGLRHLAATIDEPCIVLKLCGSADELAASVGPHWQVEAAGGMMIGPLASPPQPPLPPGYRLNLTRHGETATATILDPAGTVAAHGHAATHGGVYVYDRIATEPAHRLRGLAAATMAALASMRDPAVRTEMLVGTAAGRQLYLSLGWQDLSPYSTATLPS
jgi:GNAT superfamily N-acetyltransferase